MFDNMQGKQKTPEESNEEKNPAALYLTFILSTMFLCRRTSWTSPRQLTYNIVIQPAPHQRAQLGGVSPQSCRRPRVVAVVAMLFSTTLSFNTLNNDRLPPHKSRALVGFSWLTL